MDNEDVVTIEEYELEGLGKALQVEYITRSDWNGMNEPCPECEGTEFKHLEYTGGRYGQQQGAVIERSDYWYQHGSLYTECRECDEILFKHPAYDIIEAWAEEVHL